MSERKQVRLYFNDDGSMPSLPKSLYDGQLEKREEGVITITGYVTKNFNMEIFNRSASLIGYEVI
nr:hypothetical protein K-LCC10_0319 [Kaumoebavirus]